MPLNLRRRLKDAVKKSVTWLKLKLKNSDWKKVTKPEPGKMYLCVYDAKYKDTLPLWDAAPLSMFWKADAKHIMGLNFHYLTPATRKQLLSKLESMAGKRKYPQLSSALLAALAKEKRFEPAVHKYLFAHFKSNLVEIPREEWKNVINLPLAKWRRRK